MERLKLIKPCDGTAMERARQRWNSIAKPLKSLGLLEDALIKIAGITANENISLDKRCVVVMCADNGVVCEGVTQSRHDVTRIVAQTMAEGTSNVNLIARTFGADVFPIDIGINAQTRIPNLIDRKISYGTQNIAVSAAMSLSQAVRAICVGIDAVRDLSERDYKIIVTGEMGIGNTTTASAIAAVVLDMDPEFVTGRGAGLDSAGLSRKISVIKRAISVNNPDKNKPVELLAKLGGYDIAGMTGLFLGGAIYRIPIVIDGFISAVAAALAVEICPMVREYMLCSHVSKEPAGIKMLEYIGMRPIITAEMCLGEGTGGMLLLPLIDGALSVYNSSHSFENLQIERYVELK